MTADRDEAGFTMVELIVTIGLLSIVLVVMFGFLENTTSVTARASNDLSLERDAQQALRTVTEDLRSSRALTQCGATSFASCITVEISKSTNASNICPKRVVVYQATGANLTQAVTDYGADCTTVTKQFGQKLLTTLTSINLFTYYDATDAITPLASPTAATVTATPVVKITLQAKYKAANAPVLTLSSFASLRNNRS
jgi:prepilin-type N-terminal cleavage/methylation domain-containing protein